MVSTIEHEHEIRMGQLDKLKNNFIKRYSNIYSMEGLDEDYFDEFIKEIKIKLFDLEDNTKDKIYRIVIPYYYEFNNIKAKNKVEALEKAHNDYEGRMIDYDDDKAEIEEIKKY